MAPHKLEALATIIALSTLVTLLIKLIRILLKRKYIQGKIMPFWLPCCESKAYFSKKFRPGNRAEVFIWENFHPSCRDLGRRNRDLGYWAGPSKFLQSFTKEITWK